MKILRISNQNPVLRMIYYIHVLLGLYLMNHNLCSAHLNADDWDSVCVCDDCCQKFLDEHF